MPMCRSSPVKYLCSQVPTATKIQQIYFFFISFHPSHHALFHLPLLPGPLHWLLSTLCLLLTSSHKLAPSSAFCSVLARPVFTMLSELHSHDCSVCGKKCASSGGLVRHQNSKHWTNLLPEVVNQYIHIHHPHLTGTYFSLFPCLI